MAREELAAARAREWEDVLDVGTRCRQRSGDSRVERPPHERQQHDGGDAGANLEAAIADVVVRHPVACQVKDEAQR